MLTSMESTKPRLASLAAALGLFACELVPSAEPPDDIAPGFTVPPGNGSGPTEEWLCDAAYYDDGACDCECGMVDPDCASNADEPFGCEGRGQFCGVDATCQWRFEVPSEWTCDQGVFNTQDGCDCGCGAPDPDCQDDMEVWNCEEGQTCGEDGTCQK